METSSGGEEALLAQARRHLGAGRQAEAATLFGRVLEGNPNQLEALMLLGGILLQGPRPLDAEPFFIHATMIQPDFPLAHHGLPQLRQACGDDAAAVTALERTVALAPGLPSALNDLGTSRYRLGRRDGAVAALRRAAAADPGATAARFNQCIILIKLKRPGEAAAALRQTIALDPTFLAAWTTLAAACQDLEAFIQAESACRRALAIDPASAEAYRRLAEAIDGAGRFAEADLVRAEAARRRGVVVEPCTGPRAEARVLIVGGSGLCNTPTGDLIDRRRLDAILLDLLPAGSGPPVAIEGLPPFDIIFNAIADMDGGEPFLAEAAALCARSGRPVLNPPDRIPPTRRDRIPSVLAGIDGLTVPATRRAGRDALAGLAAGDQDFAPALLVRPLRSHGGHHFERVTRPAELAHYLDSVAYDTFYVTDYVDYRSADGYYRKYRLVFVGGQVFPCHLAICEDWLVHYFRTAMEESAALRREEEDFLRDWRSVFSGIRGDAIEEVARRLGLDYAGIDCALAADGRVLLFEANASMLVHLDDPPEIFPYKHHFVPRIFDAMVRLVARTSGP